MTPKTPATSATSTKLSKPLATESVPSRRLRFLGARAGAACGCRTCLALCGSARRRNMPAPAAAAPGFAAEGGPAGPSDGASALIAGRGGGVQEGGTGDAGPAGGAGDGFAGSLAGATSPLGLATCSACANGGGAGAGALGAGERGASTFTALVGVGVGTTRGSAEGAAAGMAMSDEGAMGAFGSSAGGASAFTAIGGGCGVGVGTTRGSTEDAGAGLAMSTDGAIGAFGSSAGGASAFTVIGGGCGVGVGTRGVQRTALEPAWRCQPMARWALSAVRPAAPRLHGDRRSALASGRRGVRRRTLEPAWRCQPMARWALSAIRPAALLPSPRSASAAALASGRWGVRRTALEPAWRCQPMARLALSAVRPAALRPSPRSAAAAALASGRWGVRRTALEPAWRRQPMARWALLAVRPAALLPSSQRAAGVAVLAQAPDGRLFRQRGICRRYFHRRRARPFCWRVQGRLNCKAFELQRGVFGRGRLGGRRRCRGCLLFGRAFFVRFAHRRTPIKVENSRSPIIAENLHYASLWRIQECALSSAPRTCGQNRRLSAHAQDARQSPAMRWFRRSRRNSTDVADLPFSRGCGMRSMSHPGRRVVEIEGRRHHARLDRQDAEDRLDRARPRPADGRSRISSRTWRALG